MRALRLAAVFAAALAFAPAAEAAAPRFIMISGLRLKQPVVLSDWNQNLRISAECASAFVVPASRLRNRSPYRVGEFWGPEWTRFLDMGGRPSDLKPSQANLVAAFYPARGRLPAVIRGITVFGRFAPRRAGPILLATLAAHGVRTRV
jgi:hypothetical protein